MSASYQFGKILVVLILNLIGVFSVGNWKVIYLLVPLDIIWAYQMLSYRIRIQFDETKSTNYYRFLSELILCPEIKNVTFNRSKGEVRIVRKSVFFSIDHLISVDRLKFKLGEKNELVLFLDNSLFAYVKESRISSLITNVLSAVARL